MSGFINELKTVKNKKAKVYSVAIRKRNGDSFWELKNPRFEICRKLNCHRYWAADPFLFERQGTTYLFYEWFDLIRKRGYLAYSVIDDQGQAGKAHIIIKGKTHFSFPCIFELNGEICILPETSEKNNLELYVATDFPNQWEKKIVLKERFLCCDSVVFHHQGKCYIVSSALFQPPKEGTLQSCYVNNILFSLEGIKLKAVDETCGIGDYGIRNAGKILQSNQKMIRVGQLCSDHQYGKGIVFWNVKNLHPYEEIFERQVSVEDIAQYDVFKTLPKLIGFHTYNRTEQYEVIDISYEKHINCFVSLAEIFSRYCRSLGGKVKKRFYAEQD